jgi:membrane-bound serine protease (ClpP class)
MEGVVRNGGYVYVKGELWRARSEEPLAEGQRVRVESIDGLSLGVRPVGSPS